MRKVLAVLIALRALGNLGKPLGTGTGQVFLGTLVTGRPMWIVASVVGLYMLVWAWTLWRPHRAAVPMGLAYLALVVVNIVRFPIAEGLPPRVTMPMYAVYGVVAIGVPALATWLAATTRR